VLYPRKAYDEKMAKKSHEHEIRGGVVSDVDLRMPGRFDWNSEPK
jgi:hypothetical protein